MWFAVSPSSLTMSPARRLTRCGAAQPKTPPHPTRFKASRQSATANDSGSRPEARRNRSAPADRLGFPASPSAGGRGRVKFWLWSRASTFPHIHHFSRLRARRFAFLRDLFLGWMLDKALRRLWVAQVTSIAATRNLPHMDRGALMFIRDIPFFGGFALSPTPM